MLCSEDAHLNACKSARTLLASLILLVLTLPFGIGLQTLALFASFLIILIGQRRNLGSMLERVGKAEKTAAALLLLVILLQISATLWNSKNPEGDVFSFGMGFLPLVLIPIMHVLLPSLKNEQKDRLERVGCAVMVFWALVALSQHIWGWKISGIELVQDPRFMRSQGFYSHPLTLAYVALMLWPFHLVRLAQDPKNIKLILNLLATLALLYLSSSRTAQAVTAVLTFGFVLWNFKGRTRTLAVSGMILAGFIVLSTPNLVSQRFHAMRFQVSEEKESSFADDRVAFWIVHKNMVLERPMLGHGINLDRKYRVPYYEAIGLYDFKKAYEAHNQLIQLAAEGGIPCAIAFLAWLATLHRTFRSAPRWVQQVRDLTIIGLLLGGMTQNAYFDGEVRFALILLMSFAFALFRTKTSNEPASAS